MRVDSLILLLVELLWLLRFGSFDLSRETKLNTLDNLERMPVVQEVE